MNMVNFKCMIFISILLNQFRDNYQQRLPSILKYYLNGMTLISDHDGRICIYEIKNCQNCEGNNNNYYTLVNQVPLGI